ncbi:hypothetical protein ASPBRDRAFT_543085 [Aspergillus brasiliensis CBS 101740]|uniref:LRAT domain-containing protein n=1 Tax=Aspergillus brasiliensis (strain CBS 101740 / IMI 381727 / IBT 21946) TaxID=767769 RepID=A0A1L9ULT4_ASPBC|nr:hypothetical protein ASPBRDRAFT_543085 [Aspergillus brasiliensis CBS 101740]
MARKLRTLQFPLASVGSSSSSSSSASKPGVLVNPVLSHWGLLVGETDLLVEIMAKAGKSKWAPLLELHVSEPISKDAIKERKGEFKWGIFNLPDTEFANWRIVDAAKRIVNSKKYYNLATYNCQSFVKDLVKAITPSSFWNTAGDILKPGSSQNLIFCTDLRSAG